MVSIAERPKRPRTFQRALPCFGGAITLSALLHEDPDGGFWCEVPAMPGCASEGDSYAEALYNITEAAEGCLLCIVGGERRPVTRKATARRRAPAAALA